MIKNIFNKQNIFSLVSVLFFASLLFSFSYHAYAQTGDSIVKCGDVSPCELGGVSGVVKGVLSLLLTIGLPLLFIFVAYRFVAAWFSLQQGNANAYKEAISKAGNAIVGFILITILIGGGLYTILSFFGVKPEYLKILQLFSGGIVDHAYAQTQLPNPIGVNNLYDFILSALRLVMRFFIYPALIVIWVWTGFSFVLAQGNPDALNKAKKWLLWAFITTLIIVVLQGFLLALRTTALKIIAPSPGQACTTAAGTTGQMGTDGVCYAGR
jgi:hypothetical protein